LGEKTPGTTISFARENDDADVYVNGTKYAYGQSAIALSLKNGASKTYYIKVRFGKLASRTYKVVVYRKKSTDNTLSDLWVTKYGSSARLPFNKQNDPAVKADFEPGVNRYYLHLDEHTGKVTVRDTVSAAGLARASFSSRTFSVCNGAYWRVSVRVTAQSGAKRYYYIVLDRARSTDSALKYIKTSSSRCRLSPYFVKTTHDYTVTMPSTYGSVKLYFGASGYGARIYVDGVRRTYLTVRLAHGESRKVNIEVFAQDTSAPTTKYTVTVTRP
jgi:hypothetical protein